MADLEPIKNEQDYLLALEEINELMDATSGPRLEQLKALVVLVEAYEDEVSPWVTPEET